MINILKKWFGKKEHPLHPEIIDTITPSILHLKEGETIAKEMEPSATNERLPMTTENNEVAEETQSTPIQEEKSKRESNILDYQMPQADLVDESLIPLFSLLQNVPNGLRLPLAWSFGNQTGMVKDLTEIKNVLITGTSATGKTNFLHQLAISLLVTRHPLMIKMIFIDGQGLELSPYGILEKHFVAKLPGRKSPVILNDGPYVIHTLNSLLLEMNHRYELLSMASVRHIEEYHQKLANKQLDFSLGHQHLPDLVLLIDDLSALTYNKPGELFEPLKKIIAGGYKVGMYIIMSTNQSKGHALPGELVTMIEGQAVFRLNRKEDYRKFLDTIKFEIPTPTGSFLYKHQTKIYCGNTLKISSQNILNIVTHIKSQPGFPSSYTLPESRPYTEIEVDIDDPSNRDSLFEEAAKLIVQNQVGSTSLIQRRMKLGYNRAVRLMDQMEAARIVGPSMGSKARDVYIKTESDLIKHLQSF